LNAADSSEERKKELVELVLCRPISTFFREKRAIPEKILFFESKTKKHTNTKVETTFSALITNSFL